MLIFVFFLFIDRLSLAYAVFILFAGSGLGAARGGGGPTLRRLIAAVEDKRLGQPGHRKVSCVRRV